MNWKDDIKADDKEIQEKLIAGETLPQHLAIIMDGNGRWALDKGFSRIEGHKEGIESVRDIVRASSQLGIKFLTLYAFSIENWSRPLNEVGGLMKLLEIYLRNELDELHKNHVKFNVIGKLSSLPKIVQRLIHSAVEKTKDNDGLVLTLALSYSGRWDIVRAVQMVALDIRRGKLSPEDINDELFSSYLQTADLPDPDLLIRSSGELRLSNFLLWEMAYGEIYVTKKFWPAFRRNDLYEALANFCSRERRFGKTSSQIDNKIDNQKESIIKQVMNALKKS